LTDPTAHQAVIAQLVSLAIVEVVNASVFMIGSSSNQASKACIFCELSGLFLVVFGVLHTAVFKQQLSASAWSFYITLFGNNFRVLILLW